MTTEGHTETTWDNSTTRAPFLHSGATPPLHPGTASSAPGAPTHVNAEAAGAAPLRRRWARHAHAQSVGSREARGATICCAALGSRQIRVSWLRVTWSIESKQRGGGRRPAAAAATAASGTLSAATLPARRLFGRVSVPLAHRPSRRPSSRRHFWGRALAGTAAAERAPLAGRCTVGARSRWPGSLQPGWTGTARVLSLLGPPRRRGRAGDWGK